MPIYSRSLVAAAGLSGTVTSVVPAGTTVVIRDVDVTLGVSAGVLVTLVGANGQVIWAWSSGVTTDKTSAQWRGRQVIEAGQTFSVVTSAPADVTVSGYVLAN